MATVPTVTWPWHPQHDCRAAGAGDQQRVEHVERQPEQRVDAQLVLEAAAVVIDRLAHIGVLVACAREQLHRHDIGIGVDDAAGEQGACFRRRLRAVAHARHEIAQHHHIAGEPQQHRDGQPAVGRGEQQQRAGAVDDDEPDRGEQRNQALAQRRSRLHHAVGDAAGEVVLEKGPGLAHHVPVVLPADAVGDIGGDRLVHHELLENVGRRPQHQQHAGHAEQHGPGPGDERRWLALGHQRYHLADEDRHHHVDQRDGEAGGEQADEHAFGLAREMPIERDQPGRRLGLLRKRGDLHPAFEQLEHSCFGSDSDARRPQGWPRAYSSGIRGGGV